MIKIVRLHYHVIELQKAESFFHTLFVALGAEHIVYRETRAHVAEQIYVVEIKQPVGVVEHHCFSFAKLNKTLHLAFEALCVVVYVFSCEHFSHIRAPRGIADHGSAAAYQRDGLVSGLLKPLHQRQRHKVPRSQAVRGTVKSYIKSGAASVYQLADLVLVRDLRQQSSCF